MSLLNLERKKVLIVEDDEMSFLYLKQVFLLTGSTVYHARSGSEALHLFGSNRFDLILMDIQLPDMSGTQVTHEIRLSDRNIPIIAQTAGKTTDELEKAIESGCSEVLIKPFSMEEMFEVVGRYFK